MTEQLSSQAQNIKNLMPRQGPSVILNDVSNWMMIASGPLLFTELYAGIKEAHVSPKVYMGSAAAIVAGIGYGLYEGINEAKRLDAYRAASLKEMSELRQKCVEQDERLDTLKSTLPQASAISHPMHQGMMQQHHAHMHQMG